MINTAPLYVAGEESHRNAMFITKCNFVKKKILDYIGSGWELAMIPCSGTGAVEAMVASAKGEKCHTLHNGEYGQRLSDIVNVHKITCTNVYDDNNGRMLRINKQHDDSFYPTEWIPWTFMVHGETSTGVLNNLEKVLEYAEGKKSYVGIDAVATFALERIPFNNPRLGLMAFSSCKGLKVSPGMGFVAYRPELVKHNIPGYYLDIHKWSGEEFPFTPTIQTMDELYWKFQAHPNFLNTSEYNYMLKSELLRYGLRSLGFKFVVEDDEHAMRCITVVQLDNKEDKDNLVKYCWMHGIELYNGYGNTVRISILNLFNEYLPGLQDNRDADYVFEILGRWRDEEFRK
jgi:2-aminoethylphosphonate-pyruvate transaminase